MAYRKNFPGLLVSDPRELDQTSGSSTGPDAVMPLLINSASVNGGLQQYPPQPAPQLTRFDRVVKGMEDPWMASTQNVAHLPLGEDVQNLLARGYAYLMAPDLDTSNVAVPSMDSIVANQEKAYQAQRQAAGQSGIDAYRWLGRAPAMFTLATKIPAAETFGGQIINNILGMSAIGALTNPTADAEYASGKGKQAANSVPKNAAMGVVKGLLY
jgi:hypothetical protein